MTVEQRQKLLYERHGKPEGTECPLQIRMQGGSFSGLRRRGRGRRLGLNRREARCAGVSHAATTPYGQRAAGGLCGPWTGVRGSTLPSVVQIV